LIQLQRDQVDELREDRRLTEERLKKNRKPIIVRLINEGLQEIIDKTTHHQKKFEKYSRNESGAPYLAELSIDSSIEEDLERDFEDFIQEFLKYMSIYNEYSNRRSTIRSSLRDYFETEFRPRDLNDRMEQIIQDYDRYDDMEDS